MKDVWEVQSSNIAADGKLIELGSFRKGMCVPVHVCVLCGCLSAPLPVLQLLLGTLSCQQSTAKATWSCGSTPIRHMGFAVG